MNGVLNGFKVIEIASIGPIPMCGTMFADMGADVIRVKRLKKDSFGINLEPKFNLLNRSRPSVLVDLKTSDGVKILLRLVKKADALIEGFRPGVMERLGLGPDVCLKHNPRLVYGRITGWGQEGPLATTVGHDINYLAISGLLNAIGTEARPVIPLNIVGDFGGGALYLATGVLAALLETQKSGQGQVVDAAMVDGALSLMTSIYGMKDAGYWIDERGRNLVDGSAHFYNVYETSDGKFISIGSIETKFYLELLKTLELNPDKLPNQMDRESWPEMTKRFADIFRTKTRGEWCRIMEKTDICFAPVLDLTEAPEYPGNKERNAFVFANDSLQPAPAPRFSRTVSSIKDAKTTSGLDVKDSLSGWGFDKDEVNKLKKTGIIS